MSPTATSGAIPLIERAADDVLFRRPGETLTAARLLRDARHLAAELPDGSHVINQCQDRYHFAVLLAATVLRGQICVLTSDRSPDQWRRLAKRLGDTYSAAEAGSGSPLRHHPITLSSEPPLAGPLDSPAIPGDRVAALVFTSGSTGEPVGTPKNWGTLADRSRAAGRRFAMGESAPVTIVGTVPPQHMYGFETTILLPLHTPASSWCGPAFYPVDIREALQAVPEPRMLVTTPLQMRALLEGEAATPALAAIVSATAPLDTALAAAVEERCRTHVLEIFGATEVGSIASRRTVAGDLWTTYDQITLHMPEGTSGASPQSGTIVTAPFAASHALSDVVELPDPTHFRLLGRAGDLIKLGGRRASLAGLTRILTQIPGVVDGVFLAPDDLDIRPSARLLAFAIAPGRSAEDILGDLRTRIDPVFLPRRIVVVDALPRNEVGKLPREALLALHAESRTK